MEFGLLILITTQLGTAQFRQRTRCDMGRVLRVVHFAPAPLAMLNNNAMLAIAIADTNNRFNISFGQTKGQEIRCWRQINHLSPAEIS